MIKLTADGTTTIYSECFNQYYHSLFGARLEAEKVFIELGLDYALEKFAEVDILEMGFGTGFNALLTSQKAEEEKRQVDYTSLEAFPMEKELEKGLNFDVQHLHDMDWEVRIKVNDFFTLTKKKVTLEEYVSDKKFNLVYYDAFAPSSQPELWTEEIFQRVAGFMNSGGVLVTYCSKSYVQRNLRSAGFVVEKHQGPPRKREVLRAILK
ncbi:tRNA (5-methylaminomethyl-2-thiouridine)(34)-methyltransferase MnmD [uncultured Arcticibacterium sp.]|uniref:tRNA (5-methylaminomethyl-2-thiouridine)(34)-methyltransferase MnmD n=1 Tax=uncultured Arcticibacterium sp. TaxID=2173042 RepID=UPI0030F729EB